MSETNNVYQAWQVWESQLAEGTPVGYLQVLLWIWTRDYQEQMQQVVRALFFLSHPATCYS